MMTKDSFPKTFRITVTYPNCRTRGRTAIETGGLPEFRCSVCSERLPLGVAPHALRIDRRMDGAWRRCRPALH